MRNGYIPRNGRFFYLFKSFLVSLNQDLMYISRMVRDVDYEFDEFDYLVMALEDRRYLRHRGVDSISIVREFIKMVTLKNHGGASTIDMQMVRTITGYKEITFRRKLYEMTLALLINFRFSKEEIMKCYMDHAFFGSHLIGVNRASYAEYGVGVYLLDDWQKARLAAMLLKPRPKSPTDDWYSSVESRATYAQLMRGRVKKRSY